MLDVLSENTIESRFSKIDVRLVFAKKETYSILKVNENNLDQHTKEHYFSRKKHLIGLLPSTVEIKSKKLQNSIVSVLLLKTLNVCTSQCKSF